ncbi:MAG TPA: flagellar biosynthetic protein FliQ [Stellaceae bacterium]|nr:flagellar biosynthetic protein FliQ [Stellaceae bacterium]
MSVGDISDAVRGMLMLTLLVVTPFLAAAMLTSLIVGVMQAATRINDLTLSFVPRFAAVLLAAYLAEAWAVTHLAAYIERSIIAARGLGG